MESLLSKVVNIFFCRCDCDGEEMRVVLLLYRFFCSFLLFSISIPKMLSVLECHCHSAHSSNLLVKTKKKKKIGSLLSFDVQ